MLSNRTNQRGYIHLSLALRLALTLTLIVGSVACFKPTPSQLDRAANASKSMAGYTNDGIDAVRIAFNGGVISLALKDKLADGLKVVAQGGQAFNALVKRFSELEKAGQLPATAWEAIDKAFDDSVVKPFLELLTSAGALSGERTATIRAVIAGLRTAVLIISEIFGKRAQLEKRFNRAETACLQRRNLCLA